MQTANAVISSKNHSEFSKRYRRVKTLRGHKKAITAICRMLLTAIWNILSKLVPYSPDGFIVKGDNRVPLAIAKSQAFQLLRLRDYVIIDDHPSTTSA